MTTAKGTHDRQISQPTNPYWVETGKRYEVEIWQGNEAGDEVFQRELASFADFRTALKSLATFITENGGFEAWYDLTPYGSKGSRSPWFAGLRLGCNLGSGMGVDALFQVGVLEVSEIVNRSLLTTMFTRWPRVLKLMRHSNSPNPLDVTLNVVKKVSQI